MPDEPSITGLRELSYAKCESVGPLHKSQLKTRIGRLPENGWPVIESGLSRVFGLRIAD